MPRSVTIPSVGAFSILLLMLAVPAPPLAQDILAPLAGVEESQPVAEDVPVSQEVPDQAIAARIADILETTGWFEGVAVTVRQGVVTIDGITDTAEHRTWAGTLAENLEGTVAVVNRLELGADFASTIDRAGNEFERLSRRVGQNLPLVMLAIAIAAAAWLLAALVAAVARRLLEHRIPSPLLRSVVVRAISIPVLLLGIYFVLQVAGLTRLAVTVLGGTGLIGIIVGFAFRDIAENFLASLLLSVRNPFSTGDLIEVAGATGIVQNLNTRSTVLLTLDGNHVQIPNATVFKSIIKNFSSTPTRRAEFVVGIGYDSSAAQAQLLISEILQQHPAVLDRPEPLVLVDELGAATVNLRVSYWFDSRTYSPAKANSALLRLTKRTLLAAGIELPDPAREVVFPKGVPLVQMGEGQTQAAPPANAPAANTDAVESLDATEGEGDLTNETQEVSGQSKGEVPEATENLLKR
ncbi:MAG TPA: mechanosensitive ion channel family protein [Devosia sp.]|jgi:small-conductance mechanosensitive channel|nr:mechanosensitive ion channel family protein [Devosia sp.]